MKNIFSFTILFILFFSACVPEPIRVDIPEEPERIIIASQVLPDRALLVTLSNSISSLQAVQQDSNQNYSSEFLNTLLINHALVTLTVDGKTEVLQQFTKGVYGTLNLKLVDNQTYTLYVKDSITGREATATTLFLAPVSLDVAVAKLEIDKELKDTVLNIYLEFQDNPAQKNYYLLDYIPSKKKKDFSFFGLNFSSSSSTLFTDDIADANHKIKINKFLLTNPTDTFTVTLFNITKEYYEFQNAYKRRQGIIAQLTAEPITLPTNVKNGQGFFNMSYPSLEQVYGKW